MRVVDLISLDHGLGRAVESEHLSERHHAIASAMTPYARGARNEAMTTVTTAVVANRPMVSAYDQSSAARGEPAPGRSGAPCRPGS